ncbi:MAG: ATP-dependent RNA helicase [Spirochaetota bacterium]|nr:MAG: ATP-dependent RNA helicase [Spirochaetota bacterium]
MLDPKTLPVYRHREVIKSTLSKNQVVVVESPTGSGKTTQIPQILFDAGFSTMGVIGVTQPRRIAAVSVAHYIAHQYGKTIPGLIGYKMRFIDETSPDTKIAIMTDGILLQEVKTDPLLTRYGIIMVDEAHERSLNIDFILGLLKGILRKREEFKVIISSATINAQVFSEYFDECPIISIDARTYPVKTYYAPSDAPLDYESILQKTGELVARIDNEGKPGDILIFLSGEKQIKECVNRLSVLDKKKKLEILPLYGRLSYEEQERVFLDFPGKRKVIIATNIAETSVTIDGVVYVIDPGFAKLNYYNTKNFTSSLIEIPISKASCNQRKGRAGRTRPGFCYRLYSEESYRARQLFTEEEIYRTDLSEVILRMAELGIKDFEQFDFISNPGYTNVRAAVRVLELLEAIDRDRELTEIGRLMVKFPIIPRLSRMIVAAIMEYPDVVEEVLIASAFLNDRAPFLLPHGLEIEARKAHHSFRHKLGDFVSYLKLYRAYVDAKDREEFCARYYLDYKGMDEIYNVKRQLEEIVSEMGMSVTGGGDLAHYLSAVSKGLIQFVCKRTRKWSYSSFTAYGIKIHPGSVMFSQRPDFIVAGEIVRTSQMYAMSVSPLTPKLLEEISRDLYTAFVKKGKITKLKAPGIRDYTNFIKIGSEKFEIQLDRKKQKVVMLPFEKIKNVVSSVDFAHLQDYKSLKGTVIFQNSEIMSNMNLARILLALSKIHAVDKILEKWPRSVQFEYVRDSFEIVRYITHLLKPCRKKKDQKRLGFLTLLTDSNGYYWFSSYKDYIQALEESVSSLEALIDEDINVLSGEQEKTVNDTYRRLTDLISE